MERCFPFRYAMGRIYVKNKEGYDIPLYIFYLFNDSKYLTYTSEFFAMSSYGINLFI